jgi:hypothetical protein
MFVVDSGCRLPTGVTDAGDQTLVGQFAETNPADAKFAVHGSRPAAQLAAALAARAEFWRLLRFGDFRFAGHRSWSLSFVSLIPPKKVGGLDIS